MGMTNRLWWAVISSLILGGATPPSATAGSRALTRLKIPIRVVEIAIDAFGRLIITGQDGTPKGTGGEPFYVGQPYAVKFREAYTGENFHTIKAFGFEFPGNRITAKVTLQFEILVTFDEKEVRFEKDKSGRIVVRSLPQPTVYVREVPDTRSSWAWAEPCRNAAREADVIERLIEDLIKQQKKKLEVEAPSSFAVECKVRIAERVQDLARQLRENQAQGK
jgi:hypothetical protein